MRKNVKSILAVVLFVTSLTTQVPNLAGPLPPKLPGSPAPPQQQPSITVN